MEETDVKAYSVMNTQELKNLIHMILLILNPEVEITASNIYEGE